MQWNTFVDVFQKITAIISIFLNCILTYLILKKSPKQLGSYKFLMIYISWFEIIYSIIDIITTPIFFSHDFIFVAMVYTKDSLFSHQILLILNGIYCSCFGASMGMFGLHFIYRYFVSYGSQFLKTFEDARILMWMMIPVIYGCIWGFTCYFIISPTEEINNKLAEKLLANFSWELQDIAYLGLHFFDLQADGTYKVYWYSMVAVLAGIIIIVSSLVAMFYCGVRCYLRLNKLMKMGTDTSQNTKNISKRSRKLQAQLFYALVTQTAIPIFLMHIPFSIVILFSFLGKDLGIFSGIASITIALFPALDPLPTMLIIQSYRATILSFLTCSKKVRAQVTYLTSASTIEVKT
ncbi:unnamed protein product [Caenorhabditis angaria]|uniref:Serpentine receptor class r-10 n=1 Tax=Caenorhabditis angaria TaxID=860376 RepID=A0A9P1ILX7_9PELO|nr:unnamed protein product [Caenorhabditis angaria]